VKENESSAGGGAGDDTSLALSERLSGFMNASGNFGETDLTEREVGTHFNKEDITLGVDYRFNEQLVSGVAFTYSNANANVQKSANVAGGKTAEQGYTGSIYSSYYIDNFYLDGVFSYTKRDYDMDRNIVISAQNIKRQATAETESDQYSASLALGYNWHSHGFDLNPYAEVDYSRLNIDSYSERGAQGLNLNVDKQKIDSLESIVGMQLAYSWSQPVGVIRPYVKAEWHHEFKENARTIKTSFVNDTSHTQNVLQLRNDSPDRDFAMVGVGVSGVFKGGVQAFAAFDTLVGQNNTSSYQFTAGVRLAF
jgi:outer membrane autotransporter protein